MAGMPALCVGDFCETKSEWEAFSPVWGIFFAFLGRFFVFEAAFGGLPRSHRPTEKQKIFHSLVVGISESGLGTWNTRPIQTTIPTTQQ